MLEMDSNPEILFKDDKGEVTWVRYRKEGVLYQDCCMFSLRNNDTNLCLSVFYNNDVPYVFHLRHMSERPYSEQTLLVDGEDVSYSCDIEYPTGNLDFEEVPNPHYGIKNPVNPGNTRHEKYYRFNGFEYLRKPDEDGEESFTDFTILVSNLLMFHPIKLEKPKTENTHMLLEYFSDYLSKLPSEE